MSPCFRMVAVTHTLLSNPSYTRTQDLVRVRVTCRCGFCHCFSANFAAGLAWRPWRQWQHHPIIHWCCQGCRQGGLGELIGVIGVFSSSGGLVCHFWQQLFFFQDCLCAKQQRRPEWWHCASMLVVGFLWICMVLVSCGLADVGGTYVAAHSH